MRIGNSGSKYDIEPKHFEEDMQDRATLYTQFENDLRGLVMNKDYVLNRVTLYYPEKLRLVRRLLINIIEQEKIEF